MNDFTLAQLLVIDYLIDFYCQYSQPPVGVYALLKDKIQSMIKNYCEHQESDEQVSCKAGHFIRCDECDQFYKV